MLGNAPISGTPLCSARVVTVGFIQFTGTAVFQAAVLSPAAEVVGNPRNRRVLAVEIVTLPLGPY